MRLNPKLLPRVLCAVICASALGIYANTCFAQPVTSTELINNAGQHDGSAVSYEGEIIGDLMRRGSFAWVNINDGQNAIGCWVPSELIKDVVYSGSYKSKGDWVEVSGIFQRACPMHGGDLDIHVRVLRKISSGRRVVERLNSGKKNQAIVLLGVICLVLILRPFKRA